LPLVLGLFCFVDSPERPAGSRGWLTLIDSSQGMEREDSTTNLNGTVAIIPAAGSGRRMGGERAKQFLELDGRPLLAVTLKPLQHCGKVDTVILVVPSSEVGYCREKIVQRFGLDKVKKVVAGGGRRQDSVRMGVQATSGDYDLVLIHDGVRPLIESSLLEKVLEAGRTHRAVITGLPARETVKEVDSTKRVLRTYDRKKIWLVQTPQVFRYEDIALAHEKAFREGWKEATDDALLVERLGIPVHVVEGSEDNIKITTPRDLQIAHILMKKNTK